VLLAVPEHVVVVAERAEVEIEAFIGTGRRAGDSGDTLIGDERRFVGLGQSVRVDRIAVIAHLVLLVLQGRVVLDRLHDRHHRDRKIEAGLLAEVVVEGRIAL